MQVLRFEILRKKYCNTCGKQFLDAVRFFRTCAIRNCFLNQFDVRRALDPCSVLDVFLALSVPHLQTPAASACWDGQEGREGCQEGREGQVEGAQQARQGPHQGRKSTAERAQKEAFAPWGGDGGCCTRAGRGAAAGCRGGNCGASQAIGAAKVGAHPPKAPSSSRSASGSKSEKPEPTSEKRGLWHVTWGRKLLFGVPEGCIEKERYPRAWGGAPFQTACSEFYTTTFRMPTNSHPHPQPSVWWLCLPTTRGGARASCWDACHQHRSRLHISSYPLEISSSRGRNTRSTIRLRAACSMCSNELEH